MSLDALNDDLDKYFGKVWRWAVGGGRGTAGCCTVRLCTVSGSAVHCMGRRLAEVGCMDRGWCGLKAAAGGGGGGGNASVCVRACVCVYVCVCLR